MLSILRNIFRKTDRIIPAQFFDLLKASADENGGVAAGPVRDYEGRPACLFGHALDVGIRNGVQRYELTLSAFSNPISAALINAGIDLLDGDIAVHRINIRKGKRSRFSQDWFSPRVPFDEVAKELRLKRGV